MAFNKASKFNGVTSIQRDNLSNNLLLGTQEFFSWGFLQIGGFQNITRSPAVSGSYRADTHVRTRLRNSDDPSYETGQSWEGFRNDWVWESGFKHENIKPIHVSGVWVDGFFYLPNDTTYSHFVDYPNGRIVFDYPIPSTKKVEANFSHRTVGVSLASEKFIQELMYNSYDIEDLDTYLMSASGSRDQLGERRLQLPVVAIELVQGKKSQPFQLGGGRIDYNDLLFHVFADNEYEKNNIRDVILNQREKVYYLVNRSLMKQNKKYPFQLDQNGSPVTNAKNYYDLTFPSGDGGFRGSAVRIEEMVSTDMSPVNSWLHRCTIRGTFSSITNVPDTNIGNI